MSLWRWEHGRQAGGYSKLLLARSALLKFDVYLIRMPTGSVVMPHRDPVKPGFEHHRVNITLCRAHRGGVTVIEGDDVVDLVHPIMHPMYDRAYHFRPDMREHAVTKITSGSLWLLSIGWLRRAT
jgi:hypothetical protein